MNAEVANTEQAAAWDGPTGSRWAANDDAYVASAGRHSARMFARAAIAPAERVLDIGCGSGSTTCVAAEAAAEGSALGLDLSAAMLALARRRASAQGLANVEFEQGDAQVYPLEPGGFDLAISRFGCMFFADPVAAFRNIAAGLRPGGRVVLLSWGPLERNEWIREVRVALAGGRSLPAPPLGAPGIFGLAERERILAVLGEAGFAELDAELIEEPVELGVDAERATAFLAATGFAQTLLEGLGEDQRELALGRVRELLSERESDQGVLLGSSAWLTSARLAG